MPCPILSAVLLPALAVYPDHPVRIVTPVAPGGGNDVVTCMPREIVGRIIREPEIDETFIEFGIGPPDTRPEELGKNLRADIACRTGLVRKRGIHAG